MARDKVKFVIRKYVMAGSAQEAIRLDKATPVHDVWVDERWIEQAQMVTGSFGFNGDTPEKSKKGQKNG